jgi:hypothetical protein
MWEDLRNYRQFLDFQGFVGFHDINQSESTKKFWTEVKAQSNVHTIEFDDGTGTGIILANAGALYR